MDPSSPASSIGPESQDVLTPRTKVGRMLADIDDAPTPSPTRQSSSTHSEHHSSPPKLDATRPLQPSEDAKRQAPFFEQSDSESEDDLDDIRRPHGRTAQRMFGDIRSSPPIAIQGARLLESDDDLYSTTPVKRLHRKRTVTESPTIASQNNGLFVSPAKPSDEDDDELPSNPFGTKLRLQELIAQKRAERLAREAEDRDRTSEPSSDLPDEIVEHDGVLDPQIEKIMSDASRPARKASKKALMEMERETQRMSRQQALAHQMRVKKKFTTSDLLAKFNIRRAHAVAETTEDQHPEGDTTASSAPNSDGPEETSREPVSTPPTSPPTPLDRQKALVEQGALSKLVPVREDSLVTLADADDDEDLPDLADIIKSSQHPKTTIQTVEEPLMEKRGLKLARLGKKAALPQDPDSDDELEIVQTIPSYVALFKQATSTSGQMRAADSKALHNLKHLSHVVAREVQPSRKGARPSINPDALEVQLRRRAREQARQAQIERIEELKARGIDVQSAEEKEKEAELFENLLDKARQDAVELRKAEKAARREAGGEGAVEISDDEDEDQDYADSGSEDEDMEESAETQDEHDEDQNELVDEAADETEDDGLAADEEDELEQAEQSDPENELLEETGAVAPRTRKSRVIRDEDDENDDTELEPAMPTTQATQGQKDDDPFAAFNFGAANPGNTLMSPTQAFNATMQTPTQATQEESFDIMRYIAPPSISSLAPIPDDGVSVGDDTQPASLESQVPESQRITLDWETQLPETPLPAGLSRDVSGLSETPGWEPTQDRGLQSPWSVGPKLARVSSINSIEDHDTQSTIQLRVSESPAPSQPVKRRGRFGRRRLPVEDDSDDELDAPIASVKAAKRDAFKEMARRRKEALTDAEKADVDKEMRAMMDEQAEESEDEYTGLGGDDFVAPETEQDREMIDSSHIDIDERAIAAHFAEKERLREEAETSKLYKDLTTGMLRRKMAANTFDLDEDEDEMAARRRQMRQMEEAKKRRALLKDENIASLADGKSSKGKEAFLKAIADDDDNDDGLEFAGGEDESVPATQDDSTQSQSQQGPAGALHETSGNKRKFGADSQERPAAKHRRVEASMFRRPTSLLEVKESVSFLLEESQTGTTFGPSVLEPTSDPENEANDVEEDLGGSDSDDMEVEAELARQNDGGFAPNPAAFDAKAMPPPRLPASQRRTAPKPAVVDRISLKRASSSGSESAHSRTAWASGPATGGFKVPSLLRRSTTNTALMANDRGVTTSNPSRESSGSGVRMGGSKKSSLAYQARAEERKAIVEASAKRREENTARIAAMRRNSSALSRGLTGRFE